MLTIDADAHVMEGPRTWQYCDPSERKFMPTLIDPGDGADRQFWLIDGKIRGHVRHVIKTKDFQALAEASGRDMVVPPEEQHLGDVPARIRHMDEMGIDVQVMYPTIFIQQVTDKTEFEVPICKAYNHWMADVWKQGAGRLRNFFDQYRLYVSCYSSTDDIEYIAQYSTENVLMTGTDYGHVDMSVEIDALRTLEKNGKVRPELARKILSDNPARFYGIQ